jgi:hypothetical protein
MERAKDYTGKCIWRLKGHDASQSRVEAPERADSQGHPPDEPAATDQLYEEQVRQAVKRDCDRSQIDPSHHPQPPSQPLSPSILLVSSLS